MFPAAVTVIVPTLGTRPRELERALASVLKQHNAAVVPLVVFNGDQYDQGLLRNLEARSEMRVVKEATAGVSRARLAGRMHVDTEYFAFLDDDDELLPDAIALRLDAAQRDTRAALVATNGYLDHGGKRAIAVPDFSRAIRDPAGQLLRQNWLASAGGLYRTDLITSADLAGLPDYLEITYLAFSIALRHHIALIDRPTYVVYAGAPNQASRSMAYLRQVPEVLAAMSRLTSRPDLRRRLRRMRAAALHQCSIAALNEGAMRAAWRYHLDSLLAGRSLRYLAYTRHFAMTASRLRAANRQAR